MRPCNPAQEPAHEQQKQPGEQPAQSQVWIAVASVGCRPHAVEDSRQRIETTHKSEAGARRRRYEDRRHREQYPGHKTEDFLDVPLEAAERRDQQTQPRPDERDAHEAHDRNRHRRRHRTD